MHSLFEGPAQQPVSRRSSGRRLRMPSFSRFSPRGSDGRLRKSVLFTGAGLLGWSGAAAAFDIPVTPLNTVGILAQGAGYGIEAGGAAVHKAGDFLIWLNDHTFGDGDNEGAATSTTSTSTTTVQTLPPTTLPPGANAGPTVPPFLLPAQRCHQSRSQPQARSRQLSQLPPKIRESYKIVRAHS